MALPGTECERGKTYTKQRQTKPTKNSKKTKKNPKKKQKKNTNQNNKNTTTYTYHTNTHVHVDVYMCVVIFGNWIFGGAEHGNLPGHSVTQRGRETFTPHRHQKKYTPRPLTMQPQPHNPVNMRSLKKHRRWWKKKKTAASFDHTKI